MKVTGFYCNFCLFSVILYILFYNLSCDWTDHGGGGQRHTSALPIYAHAQISRVALSGHACAAWEQWCACANGMWRIRRASQGGGGVSQRAASHVA